MEKPTDRALALIYELTSLGFLPEIQIFVPLGALLIKGCTIHYRIICRLHQQQIPLVN